ncbi:MAG: VWA domain-containing protein [Nitrospinales bacterium]
MNLNLISPIYLLGILGVSIPLLIHMLTRQQKMRIKFSAVYLLFQAKNRTVKRARPNRILLLLLRCLGIIFLCLALSNPLFSFGGKNDFIPSVPTANVIVLDDSYSMEHRGKEKTIFENAIEVIDSIVENSSPNSTFSLVLTSHPSLVKLDWTSDHGKVKQLLKNLTPSYGGAHIGKSLEKGYELLDSAIQQTKRILIVTDKDKNGWKDMEFNKPNISKSVSIKVIDLSDKKLVTNEALVKNVEVTQEFLTKSKIIRVKAEIENLLKDRTINKLPVSLWINGREENNSFIDLPPGETKEHIFSIPFTDNETFSGYIEITDDGLNVDNKRQFSFQPDQKVKVLVVDGDPRSIAHQSESFYIERALNPFSASISDIEPTLSTLSELSRRQLGLFSVVMLSNVKELPFDYERKLENFVLRGGALFISMGDQIDQKFYNEKMGALLPVTLKTLNRASSKDNVLHFQKKPSTHPVLKIFSGKTLQEMNDISFTSTYIIEPREKSNYSVPIQFSNGSPAVIESEFGKGKVILYLSSLDRDWNNFPIQPTFLPWLQRWIKYSARSLENISNNSLLVGDHFNFETDDAIHYLKTPSGSIHSLSKKTDGKINFSNTQLPGVYSLFRETSESLTKDFEGISTDSEELKNLPISAERSGHFSVNIDILESYSEKISDQEIKGFFPDIPVEIFTDMDSWNSPSETQGFQLATPFLIFMALMLFTESWLVRNE